MNRSKPSMGWLATMAAALMMSAASCGKTCPDPQCHVYYPPPATAPAPNPDGGTGVPVPGPPIKIIVGTASTMEYRLDTTPITTTNSSYKIAPDFLNKVTLAQLIKTSTPVEVWPIKSSTAELKVTFTDGRSFSFKRGGGGKLSFTCYNAGGMATPVNGGSGSDGIPDCMLGTVTADLITLVDSDPLVKADFFYAETDK